MPEETKKEFQKRILKALKERRDAWASMLEQQGEDWEQSERQEGELDAMDVAIRIVEEG